MYLFGWISNKNFVLRPAQGSEFWSRKDLQRGTKTLKQAQDAIPTLIFDVEGEFVFEIKKEYFLSPFVTERTSANGFV
jgi:hypothetical protein